MPTFVYKARDKSGMPVTGEVETVNKQEVAYSLKALGYNVISIEQQHGIKVFLAKTILNKFKKINHEEVITAIRQLAAMIHSGLTILDAINSLREQTKNLVLRKVWTDMVDEIKGGKSVSEAFEKYPTIFTPFCVSMIKVGETAGILDQVLNRVAAIGLEELSIKNRLRSAMVYPVLLVCLSLVIIIFILTAILPKFVSIFEESGATLPIPTLLLLGASGLLRSYWYLCIAGVILFSMGIMRFSRSERGRYYLDSKILKIPVLGDLILKLSLTRLFRTLGEMTKSGIPVIYALQIVQGVIDNVVIKRLLQHIRDAVSSGASLTASIKVSGLFPSMVVQMINAGEKTGSLDDMFSQIGEYYDKETNLTIHTLTSLVEPLLLLFMGGMVGFLALSVLLPIFNLVRVLRR